MSSFQKITAIIRATRVSPAQTVTTRVISRVERGPQGIQGPAGGDKTLNWPQGVMSDTWDIVHNLNKYPSVTVMDSGGSECKGQIEYVSPNRLILRFSAAFSGTAYLN